MVIDMLLRAPKYRPSQFGHSSADRRRTDHYLAGEALDRDPRMVRIDRIEQDVIQGCLDALPPRAVVVDVPCGNGRMSQCVARREGMQLVALDLNQHMLQSMAVRDQPDMLRRRVQTDVLHLPLPDKCADLVVNMRMMHHLPNRALRLQVLRELVRVSRNHLITSFWTTHSWRYLRRRILGKTIRGFPISPPQFGALAQEAGIRIEQLIPTRRLYEEQVVAVCRIP